MKYYFGLLLSGMLMNCQSPAPQNSITTMDLKTTLPGTWETVAFRVNVKSVNNTDSTYLLEVNEGEWEKLLQMRPIQTIYQADNRFYSDYKNLSDSLLRTTRGMWNVFGDTLMLISPDATYQYQVVLQADKAEFRARLDWDGDGQEDDEYVGIQKKKQTK